MADTVSPIETRAPASAAKKTTRRRKAAPHVRKARPRARKPRSRSEALDRILKRLATGASQTGSRLVTLSGEGVVSARRTIGKAGAASKRTAGRIAKEWQKMDSKKRAQFLAALLGALAAASAPIVRKKLKKK
jgi:hypothetical protein